MESTCKKTKEISIWNTQRLLTSISCRDIIQESILEIRSNQQKLITNTQDNSPVDAPDVWTQDLLNSNDTPQMETQGRTHLF